MNQPNTTVPNGGMFYINPVPAPVVADNRGRSKREDKPVDPREWIPRVTKDTPSYKAIVRPLTRGLNFQVHPYTCLMVHNFRDPATGHYEKFYCCKNNPSIRVCPYCEDVWARHKIAKATPGVSKETTAAILNQLPEEEWWGNFLIRQDQNHPEYNGTVKLWPHSKYQHNKLEAPVEAWNKQQERLNNPQAANEITAPDQVTPCIPYQPAAGRDYYVGGEWDPNKSMGSKKGVPTWKSSTWSGDITPLATKAVQNPDGTISYVMDEEAMRAILEQCIDMSYLNEKIPTQEQAAADVARFWKEAAESGKYRRNGATAYEAGGYAPAAPATPMGAAPMGAAPMGATFGTVPQAAPAAAPFGTVPQAAPAYGQGVPGNVPNAVPQVPANAKISTSANPAAFMGQAPAAPAPAYAAPAAAAPAFQAAAPAAAPFGTVQPAAPAPAAPAPAQPSYVPPAAPPVQQVAQPAAFQQNVPIVETDSEDDLPF